MKPLTTGFRCIKQGELTEEIWSGVVNKYPESLIYTEYWYLQLASGGKWAALVREESDVLDVALPFAVATRLGLPFVYQPHFSQQYGIAGVSSVNKDLLQALVAQYPAGVYAFSENNVIAGYEPGIKVRQGQTYVLNLERPYLVIFKGYNQNLKRNLNKAAKAGLTLQQVTGIDELKAIIKLFRQEKGGLLKDVKSHNYDTFFRLGTEAINRKAGFMKLVRQANSSEILAGAFFTIFKGRLTYLFASASAKGKELGAAHFLLDEVIKEYANSATTLIDFEGGSADGVGRFYKGFGSTERFFPVITWNRYWPIVRKLFPF
jgi:lipid II:glycine glycyltransferase (peptidoglycan interpeptide bridge formation enzyme)